MLIDLSVTLNEKTPIFPGDPATEIRPAGILDRDGYQDHYVCCGTHVGTHMDAPSHMIAGGRNIDQIPLERFSGNGVYVRVSNEFSLEAVKSAGINEGNIVIFDTGMSDKYHKSDYFENFPEMTEDIAHYLIEKKVSIVGVDMGTPDKAPFPVHKILLGNEVLIIENLVNVGALEGKKFKVHAYPAKMELDAAPVRVVAEVI